MTLPEAPSRGLAKPPGLRTEPRVPNTLPEAPRGRGCRSAPTTSACGLMTQRRGVSSGGAWAERNQAGLCPPSRRWTRQPLRGTSRCLGPLPCFPSARPACVGLGQHPGDTAHPCCPRATRPPGRPFTPPPPQAPLACPGSGLRPWPRPGWRCPRTHLSSTELLPRPVAYMSPRLRGPLGPPGGWGTPASAEASFTRCVALRCWVCPGRRAQGLPPAPARR